MGGGELSPPSFQCSTVNGYFAMFMACMLGSLERTFAIDNCPPILATVERDSSPNGYPKDTSHSTSDFTIYVRYMGRLSIIAGESNINYFFLHLVVGLARRMSLLPPLSVCVTSPSSPLQTSYPETSSLKSLYCLKTGSMVSPSSCHAVTPFLPPTFLLEAFFCTEVERTEKTRKRSLSSLSFQCSTCRRRVSILSQYFILKGQKYRYSLQNYRLVYSLAWLALQPRRHARKDKRRRKRGEAPTDRRLFLRGGIVGGGELSGDVSGVHVVERREECVLSLSS